MRSNTLHTARSARAHAPATSATSLDPFGISIVTSLRRRVGANALIAWNVRRSGATGRQLLDAATQQSHEAAADPRLNVIVPALWRIETFAVSAGRHPLDPAPLATHPVPLPAQPIAHVGWATGVSQRLGFQAAPLRDALAGTTQGPFRAFCWEGIGADLLVHARPAVRLVARIVGITGGGARPPDRHGCFAQLRNSLSAEENRLVAHGLGRMILVTQRDVRSALREPGRLPPEWRVPAVQGIAFAFAMVNHADLPAILERSRHIAADVAPAVHDGLVYALVFSEWLGRGVLTSWRARGAFEAELLAPATRESAANRERGYPLAFALSAPETGTRL